MENLVQSYPLRWISVLKFLTPVIRIWLAVAAAGLIANTSWAATNAKSCTAIYQKNGSENQLLPVTSSLLRKAIDDLSLKLLDEHTDDYLHQKVSSYNAFFAYLRGSKEGAADHIRSLQISNGDLTRSWKQPIELKPLPISIFRGHLFPDQYYYRRTLFHYGEGKLPGKEAVDIYPLATQMPFVELAQDGSLKLSRAGGSKKLFELWSRDFNKDQKVKLYRGCSRVELNVQAFIKELLSRDLEEEISQDEISRLEALVAADQYTNSNIDHRSSMSSLIDQLRDEQPDRRSAADSLSHEILAEGWFATPDINVARRFGTEMVTYEISLNSLLKLFDHGLYMGIETAYLEFAADGTLGSEVKLDVIRALITRTKN